MFIAGGPGSSTAAKCRHRHSLYIVSILYTVDTFPLDVVKGFMSAEQGWAGLLGWRMGPVVGVLAAAAAAGGQLMCKMPKM